MTNKQMQKLKYETSVHHKQKLRLSIDQKMIDQLEISYTPSNNYQKAYKGLYYDELQKSVILHKHKKAIQATKKQYEMQVEGKHDKIVKTNEPLKRSNLAIKIPNLNYRDVPYINYDALKQTKALDHTLKYYDGGKGFYKDDELFKRNQEKQQLNTRDTLLNQISKKQHDRQLQCKLINEQRHAIWKKSEIQRSFESEQANQQTAQRSKHRQAILCQMEQQRRRRGQRSLFNYNNIARHNPITNPIQYHIDNPYILLKMQHSPQNHSNKYRAISESCPSDRLPIIPK